MPKKVADILQATTSATRHYMSTAAGISHRYNENSTAPPIYGSGQGAGDSPTRWVMMSHGITMAFNQVRHLCEIGKPDKSLSITQGPDSFIDDTTMIQKAELNERLSKFATKLQHNLQLWEELAHTTGGKLNLKNCSVIVFWFTFDHFSRNRKPSSVRVFSLYKGPKRHKSQ